VGSVINEWIDVLWVGTSMPTEKCLFSQSPTQVSMSNGKLSEKSEGIMGEGKY